MFFFSNKEIRAKARLSLNQIPGIFSVAAIPVGLGLFLNLASQFRNTPNQYEFMDMSSWQLTHYFFELTSFPILYSLLLSFLLLSIGFSLIKVVRGQKESLSYKDSIHIFSHPRFGKIVQTVLLRDFILFLCLLLPIIGGFLFLGALLLALVGIYTGETYTIAASLVPGTIGFFLTTGGLALFIPVSYSYSLVEILLHDQLENGSYSTARAVLKESARLMKGYKTQAFRLDLSMIGWYILSGITFGLAGIYVIPYRWLVQIYFYQSLLIDRKQKGLI